MMSDNSRGGFLVAGARCAAARRGVVADRAWAGMTAPAILLKTAL
jgi:hypothetical protein